MYRPAPCTDYRVPSSVHGTPHWHSTEMVKNKQPNAEARARGGGIRYTRTAYSSMARRAQSPIAHNQPINQQSRSTAVRSPVAVSGPGKEFVYRTPPLRLRRCSIVHGQLRLPSSPAPRSMRAVPRAVIVSSPAMGCALLRVALKAWKQFLLPPQDLPHRRDLSCNFLIDFLIN